MSDSTGMTVNQLIDALSKISKEHGDRTVAVYDEGWKGITKIHVPVDERRITYETFNPRLRP